MIASRRILLGIGGGIAAYRAAELARALTRKGACVRCIPTAAACRFVTPLTFEALTGEPARTELFDLEAERGMGHIELARWAELALIAPATADLIAKLAHGIADDLLTTTLLACRAPVLIAPAMNTAMWEAEPTQRNLRLLRARGWRWMEPDTGLLACGETGPGRMAEPERIIREAERIFAGQPLAGRSLLITTGPTWESWDPVRILTSRASGTLGALIADRAALLGATVHCVAGPGTPPTPPDVHRHDIESAEQMLDACLRLTDGMRFDAMIASAAVADYRPAEPGKEKLKRGGAPARLELTENPDIVATIAGLESHRRPRLVLGFAAESADHLEKARAKLAAKHLDAIVANDVSNMGRDIPERPGPAAWWVTSSRAEPLEAADKAALARAILDQLATALSEMQQGADR